MKAPRLRSWSMDEWIDSLTKRNLIKGPFTPDQRDLARNLAAAYYFYHSLGELPDRACEADGKGVAFFTPELMAFNMGVSRVLMITGELP